MPGILVPRMRTGSDRCVVAKSDRSRSLDAGDDALQRRVTGPSGERAAAGGGGVVRARALLSRQLLVDLLCSNAPFVIEVGASFIVLYCLSADLPASVAPTRIIHRYISRQQQEAATAWRLLGTVDSKGQPAVASDVRDAVLCLLFGFSQWVNVIADCYSRPDRHLTYVMRVVLVLVARRPERSSITLRCLCACAAVQMGSESRCITASFAWPGRCVVYYLPDCPKLIT